VKVKRVIWAETLIERLLSHEVPKFGWDRKFLARFSRVSPPVWGLGKVLEHAGMALEDLLEILGKRGTRHHDIGAGFLGLLLQFTLHMR
jgi:hypothetical protein